MSTNPTPANPAPFSPVRISARVAELLGPALVADLTTSLTDGRPGAYRCTTCGEPGTATPASPAAVLVLTDPTGRGPAVVRYAHAGCSASRVVATDTYTAAPDAAALLLPARAWLRPGADPAAVLLVGPRVRPVRTTDGGELQDRLLAGLLGRGFTLLTDPDQTLPAVSGLSALLGPRGRVVVTDPAGDTFYDGTLNTPAGSEWNRHARDAGRLGVVVAAGMDLHDPGRDHEADLHHAIGTGRAVAATIPASTLGAVTGSDRGLGGPRADPGGTR
jgi:hypothetical protein